MAFDEIRSVSREFESLGIILTYQVGDPGLGVSNSRSEIGREFPFEFLEGRVDFFFGFFGVGLPP